MYYLYYFYATQLKYQLFFIDIFTDKGNLKTPLRHLESYQGGVLHQLYYDIDWELAQQQGTVLY